MSRRSKSSGIGCFCVLWIYCIVMAIIYLNSSDKLAKKSESVIYTQRCQLARWNKATHCSCGKDCTGHRWRYYWSFVGQSYNDDSDFLGVNNGSIIDDLTADPQCSNALQFKSQTQCSRHVKRRYNIGDTIECWSNAECTHFSAISPSAMQHKSHSKLVYSILCFCGFGVITLCCCVFACAFIGSSIGDCLSAICDCVSDCYSSLCQCFSIAAMCQCINDCFNQCCTNCRTNCRRCCHSRQRRIMAVNRGRVDRFHEYGAWTTTGDASEKSLSRREGQPLQNDTTLSINYGTALTADSGIQNFSGGVTQDTMGAFVGGTDNEMASAPPLNDTENGGLMGIQDFSGGFMGEMDNTVPSAPVNEQNQGDDGYSYAFK